MSTPDRFEPVWMVATIEYHIPTGQRTVIEPVYFYRHERDMPFFAMTPAEYCAHIIASTRNIAATWDIIDVKLYSSRLDYQADLGAIDVTQPVKEAYGRIYVSRRHEFVTSYAR